MSGPIDPRLLRRSSATRGYAVLLVALGTGQAALLLAQAWLIASAVAGLIAGDPLGTHTPSLLLLALTLGVRGLLAGAQEWAGHRAAAAVKSQLRHDLARARLARPFAQDTSGGRLVALGTHGVEALDAWFAGYLPQLVLAVVVPIVVGGGVLVADPTSGLVIALTLPLIPAFMVLVGLVTRDRLASRWKARARLSHHASDLLRGLPTLQVFGRARAQVEGLRRAEERHASATLQTLRVAFLSALVLEALATLSVALVAVTVGLRVVEGGLGLTVALFVLVLAPEVYLPLRQVGSRFHDAADGTAAAQDAFDLIDAASPGGAPVHEVTPTALRPGNPGRVARRSAVGVTSCAPLIRVEGADLGEPDALRAAGLDLTLHRGEVVALTGPSGSGKSSLVTALLGHVPLAAGTIEVDGVPLADADLAAWRRRIAWVGQHPVLRPGTVADHLRLGAADATPERLRAALDSVRAHHLDPERHIAADGTGLSAGERRRVDLARALLAVTRPTAVHEVTPTALRRPKSGDSRGTSEIGVTSAAELLLLDEPSADLDDDAEAAVIEALRGSGCTVLVITHRPAVIAAADRVVALPEPGPVPGAPTVAPVAPAPAPPVAESTPAAAPLPGSATPGWLIPTSWRTRTLTSVSTAAAVGSALTAVGLTATSGWLLARAAEQPPVLYLLVAVVAVRALGLGRAVLRYLERLTSHVLGLRQAAALRVRILDALATRPLLGRARGEDLTRLVEDADAAQDHVVRVRLPLVSAAVVSGLAVAAFTAWAPGSGAVLAGYVFLVGWLWPWLSARVSARADARLAALRGVLSDRLLLLHEQAPLLHVTGREDLGLADLADADRAVRAAERRAASARGLGQAAALITLGLTIPLSVIGGLGPVSDGTLAPLMLAVLALTPLALHEVLGPLTAAYQAAHRTASARARLEVGIGARAASPAAVDEPRTLPGVPHLSARDLLVCRDGVPLTRPLDLEVGTGERLVVTGPSGSGKSTLLATLLGHLPAGAGDSAITGRVGVLTQDAHVFDTSVAENLRIGDPAATPDDLRAVLGAVGLDLPLDRLVGEHGTAVSGGEARRLALARVLLSRPDVILLDEPTEHLDRDTALRLLRDVDRLWPDAPILAVSHQPGLIREAWGGVAELRLRPAREPGLVPAPA